MRTLLIICAVCIALAASASPVLDTLGWRDHAIRIGDGHGGWTVRPAALRFLHVPGADRCTPCGLAQMDNKEVILVASALTAAGAAPVVAFSGSGGATWSQFLPLTGIPGGRPTMLTYLGGSRLSLQVAANGDGSAERYFSSDYGRTWPEHVPVPPAADGGPWCVQGSALVDRDAKGMATRIAEIGYSAKDSAGWPAAFTARIRWSSDGGRTWTGETAPKAWKWVGYHAGQRYDRGASEGSLVRAKDGTLIAALRTDMAPRYYVGAKAGVDFDDSLEGLALSFSRDDGKTWSPLRSLFDAGRHHATLLRMPNGWLVLTYVVRDNVREGALASYSRGCEAIVSRDNGKTWDMRRRYVLDAFEYYDGQRWFDGETGYVTSTVLDDGSILTAYGKYLTKGICLIRWKP